MQGDDLRTLSERFANLLFYGLANQMPRPNGVHKYSKGNMLRNLRLKKHKNSYEVVISEGVFYSHYAMGFSDSGARRQPRGRLERMNFGVIDKVINNIANIVAGGNVSNDK